MLEQANVGQRKALLKHASGEQFMSVITLIFNILRGNITLTDADKIQLSRHKKHIRTLVSKKVSRRVKRDLLISQQSALPICIRSFRAYLSSVPTSDYDDQAHDSSDERHLPETDVETGRRTEDDDAAAADASHSDSSSDSDTSSNSEGHDDRN